MELHVWKYLLNHTFRQLEDEHGVYARPNEEFDKFSLNYNQLAAKAGNPVSDQCRGLVIRPSEWEFGNADNWKDRCVGETRVLAWPMNRFYNYGDVAAADVDWNDSHLRVYEKVDGTCIIVYWDECHKKWHCATRSVSEADVPINPSNLEIGNMTFRDLFVKALAVTLVEISGENINWNFAVDDIDRMIPIDKEMTYVFELVSPYNQIVVDYREPRVYLLAARHTATGQEAVIENMKLSEYVRRPETWHITSAAALKAFVDTLNPSKFEGAVVCDSKFRRLKVKSPAYVLAHKSKDEVTSSPRNALEAIILEKADDIIPLITKEVGDKILRMQSAYAKWCKKIDKNFACFTLDAAGSRKRFAEQVILSGDWQAPYFNLWEKRAKSASEWIRLACEQGKLSSGSLDVILSRLDL